MRLRYLITPVVAAVLVVACGDDADKKPSASAGAAGESEQPVAGSPSKPDDATGGTGADDNSGGAGGADQAPLYVVATGIVTGDNFVGYLIPTHSIGGGAEFDLKQAVEIGDAPWMFSRPGSDSIYVASLNDPTIVRWELTTQGKFVKHETLSFTNLGLSTAYLAASSPIFSATKSYFPDEDQDQIIIWNPEKMEIIDAIALGDENVGNLKPIPESAMLIRDDKLVVTISWRDADDPSVLGDHVRVVTIDTKTDEIVDSKVEDRNVHAALSATDSKGTGFYSTYSLYAAGTEIGSGHGAPSVMLRVQPGETNMDPDFSLDLRELVGGRPAGDYTLLDDETALIRVWHPELVDPIDPADWQAVLWGEAGFKWWRWHVGDEAAVEIENQEPGAQSATIFKVDGKTYTTRYADDLSSTDLIEITPDGEFVPAMTAPGAIVGNGVIRLH